MRRYLSLVSYVCIFFTITLSNYAEANSHKGSKVRMPGHVPHQEIANSFKVGNVEHDAPLSLIYILPLNNYDELKSFVANTHNPAHANYGKYLTPSEFAARFGPSQDDYNAIIDHAKNLGLSINVTHGNRTLLEVSGPASVVQNSFNVNLHKYQTPQGREFHAPDSDPEVPVEVANKIIGIVGLDNYILAEHYMVSKNKNKEAVHPLGAASPTQGSGPQKGLTPHDLLTAYHLNSVTENGSGQILGVYSLASYDPADIIAYQSYYHLPNIPIVHVLVNGGSNTLNLEAALDLELQMALAPGAQAIYFYDGPNGAGILPTYNRIALDGIATQISSSWGGGEPAAINNSVKAENQIFLQLAAQGQSMFVASGDSGACNDCTNPCNEAKLQATDPGSQPYVCSVGGTSILLNKDKTYKSESCWNSNGVSAGGISKIWPIPSWQAPLTTAASTTYRNFPDVSLNAGTPYSVYCDGQWGLVEGTSCSAPLWAAFTARVNQARVAKGLAPLGFPNPALYAVGLGAQYTTTFHDVKNGNNNYYKAGTGYDNATGLGSFKGQYLLLELSKQ